MLYNNAQTIEYLYLKDCSDETMMDVIMSGPIATYRFMQAAHPHLKATKGVVINTGSSSRYLPSGARYGPYQAGLPGGETNPLGPRALYLYDGDRDTMFRIHGTIEPWSIGQQVSSGCIRLLNQDIIDLYERVPLGTRVYVKG